MRCFAKTSTTVHANQMHDPGSETATLEYPHSSALQVALQEGLSTFWFSTFSTKGTSCQATVLSNGPLLLEACASGLLTVNKCFRKSKLQTPHPSGSISGRCRDLAWALLMEKTSRANVTNTSSYFRRTCTELLQGSINGKETRGAEFHLRLRGRRRQKVLLNVSMRTDVAGAVSGAICVLFPLGEPVSDPDCKPLDGVNEELDLAPEADLERTRISLFRADSDSSLTVDTIAADCETPTVKKWEGGFSFGLDRVQNSPNSLISSRCSFGSIDGASSLDLDDGGEQRLRALVVDEVAANRELLTALLERCGFDVACASSTKQAAWRFEQAQRERRGFRVVFIELMMAADER
jgi:hypothetical protein